MHHRPGPFLVGAKDSPGLGAHAGRLHQRLRGDGCCFSPLPPHRHNGMGPIVPRCCRLGQLLGTWALYPGEGDGEGGR